MILRTALSEITLHTYRSPIYRIFLLCHVTRGDVRNRTVIRRLFGIGGRTADLLQTKSCGRYIVGTLSDQANIIMKYYLYLYYRLSTDSKTHELDRVTLIGHFALNSVLRRNV